jgi:hypothetical protein
VWVVLHRSDCQRKKEDDDDVTLDNVLQAIEWVKLTDLPTWRKQKQKVTGKKFYSVAPFVAWVSARTRVV